MGKYGTTAVLAVRLAERDPSLDARAAWKKAAATVFSTSESGRDKHCPRDAFLGLCETGVVQGIPPGQYTDSEKNKGYVLRALEAVRASPALLNNQSDLWRRVVDVDEKRHNQQLDVLKGLWEEGRIR